MCEKFAWKMCQECPFKEENLSDGGHNCHDPASEHFWCGTCPETPLYRPPGVSYPRDDVREGHGRQG